MLLVQFHQYEALQYQLFMFKVQGNLPIQNSSKAMVGLLLSVILKIKHQLSEFLFP
jgi:hypothetical protein